eukprot:TRINITY_DN774_c0_g1_i8.p1 TRINITY_DN774_c0_g1~~TRINITY_DN774_c0_g1_i8.p1  ORF type:complete len:156 (+),score=27.49 TRINITY_DN774_c0_g1_i8:66-470(+)
MAAQSDAMMACATVGTEAMAACPTIATRVNFGLFRTEAIGSVVRMGGRLATDSGSTRLVATDGGSVEVKGLENSVQSLGGFIEVVGSKISEAAMTALGAVPLGEQVDAELWDESVKLAHLPQMREFFEPLVVAA